MQIFKTLLAPFPDHSEPFDSFKSIGYIALFISAFLYLIQPFGLGNIESNLFIICIAFGAITFFIGILFEFILFYVLKIKRDVPSWTLLKWICSTILLLISIGIANFIFSMWMLNHGLFDWKNFLTMLYSTFLIGIFPVAFSGLFIQNKNQKKYEKAAEEITDQIHPKITSPLTTKKPSIFLEDIELSKVLYLQSMQNYVSIFYIEQDKIEKKIVRNTLQKMEESVKGSLLFRCHRSFIVNLEKIETVKGNAQGLKLNLEKTIEVIPVSRKNVDKIRFLLKNI